MRDFEKISFEQFKKDIKMIKSYMIVINYHQEILKKQLDMISI